MAMVLAGLLLPLSPTALFSSDAQSPQTDEKSAPNASGLLHPALTKILKENSLVNSHGSRVDLKQILSKKYVFVYLSGYYCHPCKVFTPHLGNFYKEYFKDGDFEVLFICMDTSKETMKMYMQGESMRWPALRFNDPSIKRVEDLVGWDQGYPFLFLLDENDQVIGKPQLESKDHQSWHSVNVWLSQHNLQPLHWDFRAEFDKLNAR